MPRPARSIAAKAAWRFASTALLLAAIAPSVRGDSMLPFANQRVVDPTGRFYVVLNQIRIPGKQGPLPGVEFALVERGKGKSRPKSIRSPRGDEEQRISARDGDTVRGRGVLDQLPLRIVVSSKGNGFAAIEKYAQQGHAKSVILVDADGRVRHEKRLTDLFTTEEIRSFVQTAANVWWLRGAWIDDRARELVLVARSGAVRVVSMDTGVIRRGGERELRRAFDLPDVEARKVAGEVLRGK